MLVAGNLGEPAYDCASPSLRTTLSVDPTAGIIDNVSGEGADPI